MRKVFITIGLIAILLLIGINIYLSKNTKKTVSNVPQKEITQEAITPVKASEPVSKDSPDGKLTLSMKTVKSDGGLTYSFSVSGKEIFIKTVDSSVSISIPYNTWAPNGKYVFLREESGGVVRFFVLSTTVSSAEQNDQTADITDLFNKKYSDFKINDVTGWGGVNLIIVNSVKGDGSKGPSFWFEMPSNNFIQLSTRF